MVGAKTHVSTMRNEVSTPGYALVNLRGSHRWGNVRLDFGVENLFDTFYALPTGGAYVGQGTTMSNPALPNYPQWGHGGAGHGAHAVRRGERHVLTGFGSSRGLSGPGRLHHRHRCRHSDRIARRPRRCGRRWWPVAR